MNYTSQPGTHANAKFAQVLRSLTPDQASTMLIISPEESDHRAVREAFRGTPWTLHYSYTWDEAQECLEETPVSVVLCDAELPDATWRSVLKGLVHVSGSPVLVVASRLADERFWAEVLNFGGYDVILKPFEPAETKWTAGAAAWKWQQQHSDRYLVC